MDSGELQGGSSVLGGKPLNKGLGLGNSGGEGSGSAGSSGLTTGLLTLDKASGKHSGR